MGKLNTGDRDMGKQRARTRELVLEHLKPVQPLSNGGERRHMSEPKLGPNRGNAGKGRPKGSVNKTTMIAKDAIAAAAEGLGGTDRLIEWAKEDEKNEHSFWTTIYPKLLPLQVSGNMDINLTGLEWHVVEPKS